MQLRSQPGTRPYRPLLPSQGHPPACGCGCGAPEVRTLQERLTRDLSRRLFLGGGAALLLPFLGFRADRAFAQEPKTASRPLLFVNLRLFDGIASRVRDGVNVRVEGNRIAALPAAGEAAGDAEVVDCGGRLLLPGLIDAHWHSMLCGLPLVTAMTAEPAYIHLVAAHQAERTLQRGFTTVRDAGGPAFALKRAIDEGLVLGPRIYPAGAMVSQTSGHGDFRLGYELPATPDRLSHAERAGVSAIADGEPEVLRRTREQLLLGASQIKLMAGGGVASPHDPLESLQFTEAELRRGVEAASDWGTYVMAHVYTSAGIRRAIRAGVTSIEHGQLADEETVRLMAGEGVWWSLQPFLADEDANRHTDPANRAKQLVVAEGTVRAYEMAQRFGVKTAWGTDILFTPQSLANQGRMLAKLTPRFYAPLDLLRIATGGNGELLALSGLRNPYDGRLGVIAPGALADLLVADGDPAAGLDFLMDPETNLRLIMKDGKVYKSTLPA